MPEWWTYTLSDFLMFSPRTWYRLIERYNGSMWPAQPAALLAGLVMAVAAWRGDARLSRAAQLLAAAAWAWVGVAFHLERYAPINWAARGFAVAFGVEAVLLAWAGLRGHTREGPRGTLRIAGMALLAVGLVIYPLLGPLFGRGWEGAESFGLMPEPTAIATTGLLLTYGGRWRVALLLVPLLWLPIAGLTLTALGAPERRVVWLCLAWAAAALFIGRRRAARPAG